MLRMFAIACSALIITILIPLNTVGAIEFSTSTDPSMPLQLESGSELELDLEAAYQIALARNLDLQVGRYDLAIVDTGIRGASGIFDPNWDFGVNGDYTKSPSSTQLEGALVNETRNTAFRTGIATLMPTGGNISIDFQTRRTETNSQFYFLNPSWYSRLGANFTQPLLRNFGTLVNRSGIVVAQTNRAQALETLNLQVIGVLQQVEDAYWDFAAAQVEVDVKEQSLKLAEQLLEETRERIRVGTSAPIDLVQSEASVATRVQDVILARNARANKEDSLKKVLGFQTPGEWAMAITTAEPYVFEPLDVDLAQSIETAISNRPEIRRQQLFIENSELSTKIARNATLPSLDLNATYGYGGLGGTLTITDPDTGQTIQTKGGINDSIDQITQADFPYWVLGLNLKVPLGNNDAKATLAQRRFEYHQAQTSLAALQQSITHDVRLAVRYLNDGAAAVDAAEASRVLAERNVEAEQTKFQNGLSTNFLVLQIQDALASAQLADLRARLTYRRAIVAYRVAVGTLLDDIGIEVADSKATESAHDLWKDVKWMQFVDLSKDTTDDEG